MFVVSSILTWVGGFSETRLNVNNVCLFKYQWRVNLCNSGPYVRLAFMPNMLSSWNKVIIIIIIQIISFFFYLRQTSEKAVSLIYSRKSNTIGGISTCLLYWQMEWRKKVGQQWKHTSCDETKSSRPIILEWRNGFAVRNNHFLPNQLYIITKTRQL